MTGKHEAQTKSESPLAGWEKFDLVYANTVVLFTLRDLEPPVEIIISAPYQIIGNRNKKSFSDPL